MTVADWVFDAALVCALPVVAGYVLFAGDLPTSVVLFVAFGLLSALAWTRLAAPDIALVEAAVGAGLTGALLVNSLDWIGPARARTRPRPALRLVLAGAAAATAAGVLTALLDEPASPGLAEVARELQPRSGVGHPVTAVLLNFRAFDTLLETVVLLVAAIAVGAYAPALERDAVDAVDALEAPMQLLVRLLVPGAILVAGYLLWRGADAPGGAFQAGAVLAGLGILVLLARVARAPRLASARARALLALGPAWFAATAAAPLLGGRRLLEYGPAQAKLVILLLEVALTISIALALVMFFPGEAPRRGPAREGRPW